MYEEGIVRERMMAMNRCIYSAIQEERKGFTTPDCSLDGQAKYMRELQSC
jgi:hypothetical protein